MPENPHTFEGSAPQPSPSVTESWGLIDYDQALARMMALVEAVADGAKPDTIIFCTHPPIVTMGRSTKSEHMSGWTGKTLEVARGGSVTYHGPSQLVVYPIVNLQRPHPDRKPNEIVGFLRSFENAIVETLAEYGVKAIGRSVRQKDSEQKPQDETGVWVGEKKIASLGLGVRRWTTFHGAAINLDNDPTAFQGIQPCGFHPNIMTNLEALLGKKIDHQEFQRALATHL